MTEGLRERVRSMDPAERRAILAQLAPRIVEPYVPHVPHPPQIVFLLQSGPEAFYGGAAGGGKSDALLMAALQYVDVPGYSALILRRTFNDLALPGAIMDRADTWLRGTDARKRGGKTWEFPTLNPETGERDFANPARLTFGYLMYHKDVEQYRGAEFQFVGIDEVTQFEERTYSFLFSRLRGPSLSCAECRHPASKLPGSPWLHDEGHDPECPCGDDYSFGVDHPAFQVLTGHDPATYEGEEFDVVTTAKPDRSGLDAAPDGTTLADVPLRMRAASNPGGVGHAWARKRFVSPETRPVGTVFVPAKIADNPSLDKRGYRQALGHLTTLEKARLEEGNWDVGDDGEVFERHWFEVIPELPRTEGRLEFCRYWDLAATAVKPGSRNKDPDWTAGALVALDRRAGLWYLVHIVRVRATPAGVENLIVSTAASDRERYGWITTRMEQEGGASGVNTIATYRRLLAGHDFDGHRPQASKLERARPVARTAEPGNLKMVAGPWNEAWLDEAAPFPSEGVHDDQVDAVSGAFEVLAFGRRARLIA